MAHGHQQGDACLSGVPATLRDSPDQRRATGYAAGDPLTLVIDVRAPGTPPVIDILGNLVGPLDLSSYGFAPSQYGLVRNRIIEIVRQDLLGLPTQEQASSSALEPGEQLDLEVTGGQIGAPPVNGASEDYDFAVGSALGGQPYLGQAALDAVRDQNGQPSTIAVGSVVGSVFTDNINALGGLTPPDALTSGDLDATGHAIAGTASHELGHTLSLLHLAKAGSISAGGQPPVMGTGAIDLPTQDRIDDREFALFGFNPQQGNQQQHHVDQLVGAVGVVVIEDITWVDFAHGGVGSGTYLEPFDTLAEGLAAAPTGSTVKIKTSSSPVTVTVDQAVTLAASGGAVSLGL